MNESTLDVGSRFLSSSLHEIRTPIQTIISTLELLEDTALNTEQLEYVRQINFSANVMLQLANNVLDFTKMKSNEFKLEKVPFNVQELTERTVDLISMDAFNKGLEIITDIDYSGPHLIKGDSLRIQQVILNLVKNAVKFTSEGYINTRLWYEKNNLHFEIIDSGIGIPEEKQSLVFKDYYQVDASTTRKYGGTGLGLSICSLLVNKMGGKIGVKSNKDGGSIFYFNIPMKGSQGLLSPEEELLEGDNENPLEIPPDTKVLIIDDNQISSQSLKKKLQYFGLNKIEIADSGERAIEMLKQCQKTQPFTLLFVDMIMPKMDGWRFAAEINDLENLGTITKYLMIPEGQLGADAKMKMLDWFKGYIYKPVKYKPLYNLLKETFTQPEELLPVEEVLPVQEKAKEEQHLPAENMTILVAEDHPVNRKLIYTFLTKFGAKVYQAENGEEAVKICMEHSEIDLIFMDIQMPVKNGTDATVELRENHFKGIIIACTANSNQDDFAEYKRLGINDILVKPFKRDDIRQLLEKWNTVLSVPEAKQILTLTSVNNMSGGAWDLSEFEDLQKKDPSTVKKLFDSFIETNMLILEEIKALNSEEIPDFDSIEANARILEQSCIKVKAVKLQNHLLQMIQHCREKDSIMVEATRTYYALDLHSFIKMIQGLIDLKIDGQ